VEVFQGKEEGKYRTIAGLVIYVLNLIPATGDHIELGQLRYEVVDMNGNRWTK
jgi:putative hemolysin